MAARPPSRPGVTAGAGVLAAGLGLALLLAVTPARAQQVALSGTMGTRAALLLVDGQPQTLSVGATARGVTLKREGDGEADVVVGSQLLRLRMGGQSLVLGGAVAGGDGGHLLVIPAGPGGHFLTSGLVNGKPLNFMIDTGATYVALSAAMATAIGLDWQRAPRTLSSTANGTIAVAQVTLTSLRVGEVQLANVPAVVLPADMPHALLGNSFLSRFTMQRDADSLRLTKR